MLDSYFSICILAVFTNTFFFTISCGDTLLYDLESDFMFYKQYFSNKKTNISFLIKNYLLISK